MIAQSLISYHILIWLVVIQIIWTQDWRSLYKISQSEKFKDYDHHVECFP